VRQAYLQATLYLCERCGDELKLQLTVGAQLTGSFTREINGLIALSRHFGHELEQVADAAYFLRPNEADKQSELLLQPAGVKPEIEALRLQLREALLEELHSNYEARWAVAASCADG